MAKDLKVEDYEALALKATGLVPMKFLKDTITEREGDVAGFEPYTAMRMHAEGLAEPIGKVKSAGGSGSGDKQPTDDEKRRAAIAIADGWQGDHHLKRINLAKEIDGKAPGTAEEADKVIQAELDRRAAAAK